jgi:hypothetical protein
MCTNLAISWPRGLHFGAHGSYPGGLKFNRQLLSSRRRDAIPGSGCGRGLKQQKLENPTIDLKNTCMKHEDLSKNVAGVSFTFGNLACLYVFLF